jgi:hypothetical protein
LKANTSYYFYSYFNKGVRLKIGDTTILSADNKTEVGPVEYKSTQSGLKDIEIRVSVNNNVIHPEFNNNNNNECYAIMWREGENGNWYPFMNEDAAKKMGIESNTPPAGMFKTNYSIDISDWQNINKVEDTTDIEPIYYEPNKVS